MFQSFRCCVKGVQTGYHLPLVFSRCFSQWVIDLPGYLEPNPALIDSQDRSTLPITWKDGWVWQSIEGVTYESIYKHHYKRNYFTLQWRHNERDGVSNYRRLDCLLNRLFRRRSKRISKLCVTFLCDGNPPMTCGFPSQRASNAENVCIWLRHHDGLKTTCIAPKM